MFFIGITGGVGSGKSVVLNYLNSICRCRIVMADDVAKSLQLPGAVCYDSVVELIGSDCLNDDGTIDKARMADKIFSNKSILAKINSIIHPAVKNEILSIYREEKEKGEIDFLFLEAALLIEEGYDKICDELWYIYVDDEIRRKRLKASRGYTDDKIDKILASQRSDEDFRKYCKWVIDNNGELELTYGELDLLVRGVKNASN